MTWLITCLLLLILQPVPAHASPNSPSMQEWYAYVQQIADEYEMDPNLCAALAAGESGIGGKEIRHGWVGNGKYYAPYNICRDGVRKHNITDWKSCTRVGIMLLAKKLKKADGNLWLALRTYNTGDRGKKYDDYIKNIERLRLQYKERKIFEDRRYLARR